MKKYRIYLLGLLSISAVSCEGMLDTSSNSSSTEDVQFANYEFAKNAVDGIYYSFISTNMYGSQVIDFKVGSDIEQRTGSDDPAAVANYQATASNSRFYTPYRRFYEAVERANLCIANIPKSPAWDDEEQGVLMKSLYAEAVTMRAYLYLELVTFWGDVPFKTTPTQADDNFFLPRTDRDEIMEFLVQDLKDAEQYAQWATNTAVRASKGFMKGLRARIALTYAGYSVRGKAEGYVTRRGRHWEEYYRIANQECSEMMSQGPHRLNPSYENIFKTLCSYKQDVTNKEVLWEMAFRRGYSGRYGQEIGMAHATGSGGEPKYGRAIAYYRVPFTYFYSFTPGDLRRNVNCELYNYSNVNSQQQHVGYNAYSVCKFRKTWIDPPMGGTESSVGFTGVNFPVMRYADVVLMLAETENEIHGGATEAAKEALKMIRKRAFPEDKWPKMVEDYVDSVATSKETFFNAIVDERAWELGGELIRKFDLIRWNLLGDRVEKARVFGTKVLNNDPETHWIPDIVYHRRDPANNEFLQFYNPDFRVSSAPSGYSARNWFAKLVDSNRTNVENYLRDMCKGYDKTRNNHLFPLPQRAIDESMGVLSNDDMP